MSIHQKGDSDQTTKIVMLLSVLLIGYIGYQSIIVDPIKVTIYEKRFRKGLTREKLSMYEQKLAIYSGKSDDHYFERGMIKYELENYIGVKHEFTKAIKLNKMAKYFYMQGETIAGIGATNKHTRGYKKAINDFNKAINILPNYQDAYVMRGYVKFKLKDFKGAMSDLTKAISLNPQNSALAYDFRGRVKFELNDYIGARDDFTHSIDLENNNGRVYMRRGNCYEQLESYAGAIENYTMCIKLTPNDGEAYYKLSLMELNKFPSGPVNGCSHLSKAGELGYEMAYESIRKYCN